MGEGGRAGACGALADARRERAAQKPLAGLGEDVHPRGTADSRCSTRSEEFCCSGVGEALICLPLHHFDSSETAQNHQHVW